MCIRGKDCIPLLKQTTKLVQGPASSVTIASTYHYLRETLENKEASGGCNHARSTLYRQATRDLYPNRCHAHIFSISMQQLNVHDAAALLQPMDSVLAYRNCFTADVVEHRQDILWNGGVNMLQISSRRNHFDMRRGELANKNHRKRRKEYCSDSGDQ